MHATRYRLLLLLALAATSVTVLPALRAQVPDAPQGSQAKTPEDRMEESEGNERDFVRNRMEWFHDQRAYPHATLPPGIRQQAIKDRERKEALEAEVRANLAEPDASPAAPAWAFIGPQPIGLYGGSAGRVTSLAIDPANTSIVYAGGAEGGLWKSTNGGQTWTPLMDSQVSLAVGAIAIDPNNSNTIYVATGEESFSGDSYYGAGLLKSTNGGSTWTQLPGITAPGPCGGEWVGAIAVPKGNSSVILAAVESCYYGQAGIYRSADGGQTWAAAFVPTNGWNPGTAVFFEPGSSSVAYAALDYGTVMKSTNGGKTWIPASGTGANVLPTNTSTNNVVGRIALAVAPSSPSTLYAALADTQNSDLLGLYKTTDGGANWTQLINTPDFCSTQCWYDIVLAVSPVNPNLVFAGGVYTYHPGGSAITRSTDGGNTWVDQSSVLHPDTHALAFTPNGETLYTGDDGGVWSTDNPTAASISWSNLNQSLGLAEFYPGISMDQANVNHTYIGTQDNGTQRYAGALEWPTVVCGDGGETVIDYADTTTVYANCIQNTLYKSTDDGATWAWARTGINGNDNVYWVPPLAIDPVHHLNLYFGTSKVYQTTDGAALWTAISSNLINPKDNSAVLTALAVSPVDPGTVYSGASDGWVEVTRNALAASPSWVKAIDGLPSRFVTSIVADPSSAATAYAGFSGFTGFGDSLGHIFKTTDAGSAWTDISGDLPNTPVDAILVDPDVPDTIFIGTDIGAFYTTTGGGSWSKLGTGLPNVVVQSLGLHEASRTLRAASHGRGAWDLNVASLLPIPTISTVSPATLTADKPATLLTITGYQFNSKSVVVWNKSTLATTYKSSGELTATVPASDLAAGGKVTVGVMNGAGGKLSNLITITVDNPVPVLTTLSQTSAKAGSAGFTLTVTGSDFVPSSKIEWNGAALTTTFKSETSLTAAVPSTDLAKAGTVQVTVANPSPGGGKSAVIKFTIN